jgi:hypothetical protein
MIKEDSSRNLGPWLKAAAIEAGVAFVLAPLFLPPLH